jgi:hypothetical protein
MSNERGGFMASMLSGGYLDKSSKSIRRCPQGIDLVRMKALGHLGVNFYEEYYGDTMNWREFESIGLKHGSNLAVKYPQLQTGWTYYYDAIGKVFTVTDDNGRQTSEKINTLSDMGIVWDILSSHQFKIYFSARFINDAFLIAWVKKRGYVYDDDGKIIDPNYPHDPNDPNYNVPKDDTTINLGYLLAYVDQFFNETLHYRCSRIVKNEFKQPEPENKITQLLCEPEKTEILRTSVPVRSATGDYSDMAIKGPDVKFVLANKKRNAIIDMILGEFLMVVFFASIMNMSKPVYEPWMLWGLWKWLGSGKPIESIEKIFDLSPRW